MLDTPCSEVVWRVLATHSIRQYPLHFSSRASPCAITFQLESTTLLKKHPTLMHESELKKKKKKGRNQTSKKHNRSVSVCMQTGFIERRSNVPYGHQPSDFHINFTSSNKHFSFFVTELTSVTIETDQRFNMLPGKASCCIIPVPRLDRVSPSSSYRSYSLSPMLPWRHKAPRRRNQKATWFAASSIEFAASSIEFKTTYLASYTMKNFFEI